MTERQIYTSSDMANILQALLRSEPVDHLEGEARFGRVGASDDLAETL
jgi:hypothetical protein